MNNGNFQETNTVSIRLLTLEDASNLYSLIDNSRAQLTNLVWSQNASLESTINFIENKLSSNDKVHGVFCENSLVGVLELRKKEDSFELGYWVGSQYRGKGVMKAAVKQLVDQQVTTANVVAHIRESNKASLKVLTNAGLTYDHTEIWQNEPWIHLKRKKQ